MKFYREIILGLVALFCVTTTVRFANEALFYPGDLALETPAVEAARVVSEGKPLYDCSAILAPPFRLQLYTPFYPWVASHFIRGDASDLVTLRVLNLFFFFAWIAALVWFFGLRSWFSGLVAILCLFSFETLVTKLAFCRMDWMALCFSVLGVALVSRARFRGREIVGGLLLGLAFMTKQTAVAAPLAIFFCLGPGVRARLQLVLGFTIAVIWGLVLTGPPSLVCMWISVVKTQEGLYSTAQFYEIITHLVKQPLQLGLLLWGAYHVLIALKKGESPRASLEALYFLISLSLAIIASPKLGSFLGYYFEALGLAVGLLARSWERALPWNRGKSTVAQESAKKRLAHIIVTQVLWGGLAATAAWQNSEISFAGSFHKNTARQIEVIRTTRLELEGIAVKLALKYEDLRVTFFPYYQADSTVLGLRNVFNDQFVYLLLFIRGNPAHGPFLKMLERAWVDVLVIPRKADMLGSAGAPTLDAAMRVPLSNCYYEYSSNEFARFWARKPNCIRPASPEN